ncbi:hypothetical protein RhiirA1_487221, partial [Rhizophagus irregularis]
MIGVMTTPTANAGFLVSLTVVLVPIMTSIIDKKLPTRDIFCLLTAFSYSIYIVLNGKFTKNVDSLAFGIYQMGFAAIISGCICLLFETPQIPSTSNSWIAVLGLGILCSAFGFIGQTVAQQYTTPTHT